MLTEWCRDVVVEYAGADKTGVVSLNPTCVPIKPPLVRKATGTRLIKFTSLEKTQSPFSDFCYA